MILLTDSRNHKMVCNLVRYIRAGEITTAQVPADYYTRQRMTLIGKRLQSIFSHDVPDRDLSLLDIEVFYIRFCEGAICRLTTLADWKGLLEQIAQRLAFYAYRSSTLPSRTGAAIQRLWLVVQALKPH